MQLSYAAAPAAGFPGMKADSGEDDCRTFAQAEASAELPFGVMVAQGGTADKAILPVDANSRFVGVVIHSHEYVPGTDMGTTGLKPKVAMAVMNKGRIWVKVEEAVAVNDRAYVRHTSGAGGTQKGAFRKSADTATAVAVPGCRYLTAASANGMAILSVDMPVYFGTLA
jgi:hypothetical protein